MKKSISLLILSVCCLVVNAAVPERKMLEQGKMWGYAYHEVDPYGTSDIPKWMVYYRLEGDTVIDGRQYMKMYRWNDLDWKHKYFGAFREDEEGRVYHYGHYNDKEDTKVFDLSMDFEKVMHPDTVVVEKIKENGKSFRRYRYQKIISNGTFFDLYLGIEGVGYQRDGFIHFLYERGDCPDNYEDLAFVQAKDFYFSAGGFQAPKEIELADDERQLITSNNDFAFNLFRQARGETSSIMSPLSITFALGLMNNGAAGQTLEEINRTLGFGEAGADAINSFCQKMLADANTLDEKTKALIANTIFVNEGQGYQLQNGFIEKAYEFYNAQPQNRDFNDGQTMDVINQWASDHTEGLIPTVLDKQTFNPWAVSYLLNAIYFKGEWTTPFDVAHTKDEAFGGGPVVPMMHKAETRLIYEENDLYQAVNLPYGNGAYNMRIFLPRESKTISDVLDALNGSNWHGRGYMHDVDLKLPRFETNSQIELVDVMSALGMPTAFTVYAEFPSFCNVPVYIGNMCQVAIIKLDEQGTEAAAVTVIDGASSVPDYAVFHANRPFLYIISEQSTGAIFFIGQYTGGVNAKIHTGIASIKQPKPSPNLYNLSGQRLSKVPARGLYIQNGKKILK